MTQSTLPKKPVENWEQIRDDWIAAVDQLVREAESWSQKQNWAVRREPKTVVEDRLGTYTVPRLLIHSTTGRLLLDPVARYIPGGLGLVDLSVLPSYDSVMIPRTEDGWYLHPISEEGSRRPWSEQAFLDTARQLVESA